MILIFRDEDVVQSSNWDDEGLEVEYRNGAEVYRLDPNFYTYERYVGDGKWVRDIPFERVRGEDDC